MALLTTKQVAESLGVSDRRILALIDAGRLPAQRIGRDWLIEEKDLKLVEVRKPGRPPDPKKKKESNAGPKPSPAKQKRR